MAEEREVQILSTVDLPSRDPKRAGQIDVLVTYRISPYQTGLVRVPKETFNEKTMLAAIKKDVESKAAFVGKKFTL